MRKRLRRLLLVAGTLCVIVGLVMVLGPLFGLWQRGQADQDALNRWITHPVAATRHHACGGDSASDYALVTFSSPSTAQYDYAGVAGDGTWDLLRSRSMVHYHDSPAPGQVGNVIIAFHREPDYEHIDQLGTGGTVTIQDRACRTYTYTITQRWILRPADVRQLVPTTGHDLTLITCHPWWVDSERIVWRATLVG